MVADVKKGVRGKRKGRQVWRGVSLVRKCMTRENNKGEGRRKLGIRTGEWEGGNRCVNGLVRMGKVWRAKERDERKWVCTKWHPSSHPPKYQTFYNINNTLLKKVLLIVYFQQCVVKTPVIRINEYMN